MEKLLISHEFDVIQVLVDMLSKCAHFIPFKHPFTTTCVAEVFLKEVVKLHGFQETMVFDYDKIFLSKFWNALFISHRTTLHKSTSYRPKTDGQTEVVNSCLETYLRCYAGDKPRMLRYGDIPSNNAAANEMVQDRDIILSGEPEVMIKWKGLPAFEFSWEPINRLVEKYLRFYLEDKVSSLLGVLIG